MSSGSIKARLRELKELLDEELISSEEYEESRRDLLAQLRQQPPSSTGLSSSPSNSTQKKVHSQGDLCLYCCLPLQRSEGCSSCGPEAAGLEVEVHPNFLPPGTVLDGKFIVGRVLGHGGFGITYLASDENLKMQVAIKEYLPRELASRDPSTLGVHAFSGEAGEYFEGGLERFLDEARTLARFNHRAIVPVLGYFQENGTAYLVMRYLAGRTLEEILLEQGGRIQEEHLKAWIAELLEGLSVVHSHQLLHRDIKPANLFLTETGQLVLLDFGTARVSTAATGSLTQQYTPGFAPPEQCGMLDERQGPWTDIYGVGATAYQLLTGVQPVDAMLRLQGMPQPSPASLPAVQVSSDFETWLTQAMAMAPGERYQSAQDARAALYDSKDVSVPRTEPGAPIQPLVSPVPPQQDRKWSSNQMTTVHAPSQKSGIGMWLPLLGILFLGFGFVVWWIVTGRNSQTAQHKPGRSGVSNPQQKASGVMLKKKPNPGIVQTPVLKAGALKSVGVPLGSAKAVWLPKGVDLMGSPHYEGGRDLDEKQHRIKISRGFWIWQTEVTQLQFRAIMGRNPSHFKSCGEHCPVENVNWYEAALFAHRLSGKQNLISCFSCSGGRCTFIKDIFSGSMGNLPPCNGWRLPTESEWEYAARAGNASATYGSLNLIAWWGAHKGEGNSQVSYSGGVMKFRERWGTHPVGQKQPNSWGIYDMLGNVWEWTLDVYKVDYESLPEGLVDPLNCCSGRKRVIRGGSWNGGKRPLRSANRYKYDVSNRDKTVGFRLVRNP